MEVFQTGYEQFLQNLYKLISHLDSGEHFFIGVNGKRETAELRCL